MTLIRLNKYIADQGYCSRRRADELIKDGKVKLNGKIVKKLGTKINTQKDRIEILNTKYLIPNTKPVYLALNKPERYISSTTSKQGKSVMELIPKKFGRLYPVGRLDKNSEGLIILTNDGELTNVLTHPRYEHEKEYEVVVDKSLNPKQIKKLEKGMVIENERMKMRSIKKIKSNNYRVVLKMGKKRQIRVMLKELGVKVIKLKRIRINKLKLGSLPSGKWKEIKKHQIM